MSENTKNLNLFKYDVEQDKKSTFNVDLALNNNWDKIDSHAGNQANLINNKVSKSGDTMSGNLIVAKDQGTYNIKEPNLDYTSKPTSQHVSAFRCLDKNSKILGDIRFVSDTDGTQTTSIFARHARTGSEKNAALSVVLDKDGNDRVATANLSVTNATVSNGRLIVNNPTAGNAIQVSTAETNKSTVYTVNTAYDNALTTAPSAHTYIGRYRGLDKNGREVGAVETVHDTGNNIRTITRASRTVDGATKTSSLDIGIRVTGSRYANFSVDEFMINARSVPYLTARVVSGTSYYEIWSENWIRQGGVITMAGDSVATVTLLKNYSNTNYGVNACLRSDFSHNGDAGINAVPVNNTSFQIKNGAQGSEFVITWEAWGK